MFLIIIWLVVAVLQFSYRIRWEYKRAGEQPFSYIRVKKFFHFVELAILLLMISNGFDSYIYLIIIPLAFLGRFLSNFIAFKREADKLEQFYIKHGIGVESNGAFELANDQIHRDIENGIRR